MTDSRTKRKKGFEERINHLSGSIDACCKRVETELSDLKNLKGELSGMGKELARIQEMLADKKELTEEKLDAIEDAVEILEEEFEEKRKKDEDRSKDAEKDYLTQLQYLKAEFENYKRRTDREKREFGDYMLESFIRDLLPIKDALGVAISHAKENQQTEGLIKGVELTLKQINELFAREGLEEIQAEGMQFDPFRHEVASKEVVENHPENMVIEVLRKGYLFRGKVIRPAMVKIAINEHIEGG